MLTLRRIKIENFVIFDKLVVEPSTNPDRRLTVIRAANESGKTTFLRAVRWGMYGEKGLPGDASRYSLHPAWWNPTEGDVETQVTIDFETDGSSRNYTESDSAITRYQLVRSVRTTGTAGHSQADPDFRRIDERTRLMVQDSSGSWSPAGSAPDIIVDELLPWGLRDFFVMDTDEAADFVGGSENKELPRREVETKITDAVRSLLGIEVFARSSKRVEKIGRSFGARATKAIGDHDLTELQNRINHRRAEKEQVEEDLHEINDRKSELQDNERRINSKLEEEIHKSGKYEGLDRRLTENRVQHDRVTKNLHEALGVVAGHTESLDLLASLASAPIRESFEILKPLHDKGHIPLTHLHFVRDLLQTGECVCGQNLADSSERRSNVERRVTESSDQEQRAGYLYQLHDAAHALRDRLEISEWQTDLHADRAKLAEYESEHADVTLQKKDIDALLKEGEPRGSIIQTIRDELAATRRQLANCEEAIARQRPKLDELSSEVESLDKTIHQRQRNERAANDDRIAEELALQIVEVVNRAYRRIEQNQVSELSDRMDRLFFQMAANIPDELDPRDGTKATIRMIDSVGVRPVEDRPDIFEIYSLNRRGRAMPPTEINGASRRVLALSFVLALCIESQTRAPLIADSLLNFMSGTVRRNTLRVTAEHSLQPILLLTYSDLEVQSEVDTVEQFAGATYTLTAQWHAIDAGSGGDVVQWTEDRQVSLLCTCGPRQYCNICERSGQAETPGWSRRTDRGAD